jgi:hypothetical protein
MKNVVLDRNVWVKSISIDQMSSNLGSVENHDILFSLSWQKQQKEG